MSLSPHTDWNGTKGTGYSDGGGGGVAIPTDPTRTTYKPAARWMVPQSEPRFVDTYKVQVAAFAKGGIDSVTFYCEGASETVSSLSLFSDGNFGYECVIDTSLEATDGELEIYAEVNPTSGSAQKRVLGPLHIWSNSNGTLANTGTVFYLNSATGSSAAAGTIGDPYDTMENLVAGENAGLSKNWSGVEIRIQSATGNNLDIGIPFPDQPQTLSGEVIVTYDAVNSSRRVPTIDGALDSSHRIDVRHMRVKGLKIEQIEAFYPTNSSGHSVTFEDCLLQGDDVSTDNVAVNGAASYMVDCDVDTWLGAAPFRNLARNCTSDNGSGDVLSACAAAFGVTVTNHRQRGAPYNEHTDWLQLESASADYENRVYVGVSSVGQEGQGLFLTRSLNGTAIKDVAVVNCVVDVDQGQINWPVDHLLLYHNTFYDDSFQFNEDVGIESLAVTGISGSFSGDGVVSGASSGFTANTPKNAGTSSSPIYIAGRSGTPIIGETVTTTSGGGTATVDAAPVYVAANGYNESRHNYFKTLLSETTAVRTFVEGDWVFDSNAFDSAGWNPGTGVESVSDPFVSSASLDFSPSGMPTSAKLSQVPYDADGNARAESTAIGALAASSEYGATAPSPKSYLSNTAASLL